MSDVSSFFSLFKRGGYYRAPDSEKDSSGREERERFIAAALAFCLRHDVDFRRAFWTHVCRTAADPEEMPSIASDGILLEPAHWSDLRLISNSEQGRIVWVVELKTGANLQTWQNPSSQDFHREMLGYGWFLHQHEPRESKLRYIVLGAQEKLSLPLQHGHLPIHLRQSTWTQVAECISPNQKEASPLVRDFFACLGKLHLHPFTMLAAQNISVSNGLVGLGPSILALHAVCDWLGAKWQPKRFTIDPTDAGCVFGIYVRPERDGAPSLLRLQKICDHPDDVAWFGYRVDADDTISRCVWLYFAEASKRDTLLSQIRARFFSVSPSNEDGAPAIEIVSSPNDRTKDLAWFQTCVDAMSTQAS